MAASIMLAAKRDISLWLCVDYQKLNSGKKRDHFSFPIINGCIQSLGDATIVSTLDPNSGHWQIEKVEKDWDKEASTLHHCNFIFVRMPLGKGNAFAKF